MLRRQSLANFFLCTLVGVIPRSSSAPTRGFVNVNGHRQANPENYSQHLLRSPSHGNNFIMQSNHSTSTNANIIRDQFFPQTFSPTISSISSPPPAPPMSFIPPPPPLPEQLLTTRSSLWSSIQLANSARRDRSHSNTNPRKILCRDGLLMIHSFSL